MRVGVGDDRDGVGEVGQNLKKGVGNIGGLHKIGVRTLLPTIIEALEFQFPTRKNSVKIIFQLYFNRNIS